MKKTFLTIFLPGENKTYADYPKSTKNTLYGVKDFNNCPAFKIPMSVNDFILYCYKTPYYNKITDIKVCSGLGNEQNAISIFHCDNSVKLDDVIKKYGRIMIIEE